LRLLVTVNPVWHKTPLSVPASPNVKKKREQNKNGREKRCHRTQLSWILCGAEPRAASRRPIFFEEVKLSPMAP
jgi:hypothetical protein